MNFTTGITKTISDDNYSSIFAPILSKNLICSYLKPSFDNGFFFPSIISLIQKINNKKKQQTFIDIKSKISETGTRNNIKELMMINVW